MRYLTSLALLLFLVACRDKEPAAPGYTTLTGQVIGTYYSVKYDLDQDLTPSLDSLFDVLNQSLSTYVSSSTISRLNQADDRIAVSTADPHFLTVLQHAETYYHKTDGAFDPTVMPLVNFWGFGYQKLADDQPVDSTQIPQILTYVGFDKVSYRITDDSLYISKPAQGELDFSANAKGYYIDVVGNFLKNQGASNYLVDIGGETLAHGHNPSGNPWTLGINTPSEKAGLTDVELIIRLTDAAVATSGNYRNYRLAADGSKYVHTIDPATGFSRQSDLLSATVIAPDCMTADALATACIVLGSERALSLIESLPDIEAYFITPGQDSYQIVMSGGFDHYLVH